MSLREASLLNNLFSSIKVPVSIAHSRLCGSKKFIKDPPGFKPIPLVLRNWNNKPVQCLCGNNSLEHLQTSMLVLKGKWSWSCASYFLTFSFTYEKWIYNLWITIKMIGILLNKINFSSLWSLLAIKPPSNVHEINSPPSQRLIDDWWQAPEIWLWGGHLIAVLHGCFGWHDKQLDTWCL